MPSVPPVDREPVMLEEVNRGVQAVLSTLLSRMEGLTSDGRLQVFHALNDRFCPHCGVEQPDNGWSCECWNDE